MCSAWRNSWRTGKVLPPVTWSGSRRVVALVVYVHTFHAIVVNFDHFWFLHGPRWNNYASPQVNFRIWSSVCGKQSDNLFVLLLCGYKISTFTTSGFATSRFHMLEISWEVPYFCPKWPAGICNSGFQRLCKIDWAGKTLRKRHVCECQNKAHWQFKWRRAQNIFAWRAHHLFSFAQAKLQNVLSASVTSRILIPNFSGCNGLYCLNKSLLLKVTGPLQSCSC